MDPRILYTILTVLAIVVLNVVLKEYVRYKLKKYLPKIAQKMPFRGTINVVFLLVTGFILLGIWGVSYESLWVFVTGIAALIAIAFFAVWSILSNLLAGVIMLSLKKLNIGDEIVILPEKVKGKVVQIGVLFFVLQDKKYNISVPNNQFFQKFVKIKRKR